ncbi:MAG: hypothetical protein ABF899_00550 [Oenococcus sp.]|uniref:hypothetical protein n=1 Tax=Oenococcus sp. TaxID=1979414 RepID=UPI0039EC890E
MPYNLIYELRQVTHRIQKSSYFSCVTLTVSLFVTLLSLILLSNTTISNRIILWIESLDKPLESLLASLSLQIYFERYLAILLIFFFLISLFYLILYFFRKPVNQQHLAFRFQAKKSHTSDRTGRFDSTSLQPFSSAMARKTFVCALSAVFLVIIVLLYLHQPIVFSEFAIVGFLGTILMRLAIFGQYQKQSDVFNQISNHRLLDKWSVHAFSKHTTHLDIVRLLCLSLVVLCPLAGSRFSFWFFVKELVLIAMLATTDISIAQMFMNLCVSDSGNRNTMAIVGLLLTGLTIMLVTMSMMVLSLLIEFTNLTAIYVLAGQLLGLGSVLFLTRCIARRFESNWFKLTTPK